MEPEDLPRLPTTDFILAIVCIVAGFIIGPSMFGLVAANVGRVMALPVTFIPALLVAPVTLSRRGSLAPESRGKSQLGMIAGQRSLDVITDGG